jgi:hypothetical protein
MRALRQNFLVGVASSLTAGVLLAAGSALTHARLTWQLAAGIAGLAVIIGLAVFGVLTWRRQAQLEKHLARLEQAAWPGWMRDIAFAAQQSNITVLRDGDFVVFENCDGERHMLSADPPGGGLGQVLERDRALEQLAGWGMAVRRNSRGQPMPAGGHLPTQA